MASKHKKTFYLENGTTFSNVEGFAKRLLEMSEDVYNHHVTPAKNDFANWLRDSMNEENLAEKIDSGLSKMETELEVLRHLVYEHNKKPASKTSSSKKTTASKNTSSSTKKSATNNNSSSKKNTSQKKKSTSSNASKSKK